MLQLGTNHRERKQLEKLTVREMEDRKRREVSISALMRRHRLKPTSGSNAVDEGGILAAAIDTFEPPPFLTQTSFFSFFSFVTNYVN